MTEREIFLTAAEILNSADRAAFLDKACEGDPVLREQVEALLKSHDIAGSFLGSPAVAPSPDRAQTLAFQGNASPDCLADKEGDFFFLAPPERADSIGRIGHYEVLEVLGRGGFGIVFRAFDDVLQRVVAVKVLAPEMAATSPARKRFLREARSSAKVRHQNVVQIHAVEEQPLPYLVMEYIPGETLQERLDRTGPLDTGEVLQIGRQIAEGLSSAHDSGLIHRDIKPGNILMEAGQHPNIKITDFGLARAADDASMTQSGVVAGTPMYMAPEQAEGKTLDHRADLFSLGSVLYTMTSGRPPFRAPTTLAILKRVAEDTPRPIPEIIPEVPSWLCDIIARLQAKKPEDRFASAREVADLLRRCQAQFQQDGEVHALTSSPPLLPTSSILKSQKPRRQLYWIAAASVCFLFLLGLCLSEATGVTDIQGTVICLFSPHGTLVVEVDDPRVSVTIDGEDIVVTGAGMKELRLKPGRYKLQASKDGKVVRQELVTIANNGHQVVRITLEANNPPVENPVLSAAKTKATAWEESVAKLPAEERVNAVIARLKELNPGFDGTMESRIENEFCIHFWACSDTSGFKALSPFRGLSGLQALKLRALNRSLTDLSPLEGLDLNDVIIHYSAVSDLTPLNGLKLIHLDLTFSKKVRDLEPLRGMPLRMLSIPYTQVEDLSPLEGMKLDFLNCSYTKITNLSSLKGVQVKQLLLSGTGVSELKPLSKMRLERLDLALTHLDDLTSLRGMTSLEELHFQEAKVTDLSPLRGLPLKILNCSHNPITDLSPLKGMPLTQLFCDGTKAPDLTALREMPLTTLNCRGYDLNSEVNREVLRSFKNLEIINSTPVVKFWKELEADPK